LKRLRIRIPPNVQTGSKVRYKGMGLKGDGRTGDLYIHIRVH
jgi:DnaJ-class molecular chaperone